MWESRLLNVRYLQRLRNRVNRKRLTNPKVTIISSNCAGGILYHWLGLQFRSPFINLYLENKDFLLAMENFDDFINAPIVECKDSGLHYPLGISKCLGIKIHFMHYDSFQSALAKWNERKKRMDMDNICVMFTNWNSQNGGGKI